MREDRILWLVDRIYNTFGRTVPKQGSGQMQVLCDNLSELPDECARYIARKATDLDDMPRNLTKFCFACWREWQTENPGNGYRDVCGTCNGDGGWTYFRQVEGNNGQEWHEFFSPCPVCTYLAPRHREKIKPLCKYPWDLEKEGCIVMPAGYKGGVLQFKSDKGIGPQVFTMGRKYFACKVEAVKADMAARMTA